ncbi:hypothetical protein OKW40_001691 [Paraburkholderia sp. RAU6.4a]
MSIPVTWILLPQCALKLDRRLGYLSPRVDLRVGLRNTKE